MRSATCTSSAGTRGLTEVIKQLYLLVSSKATFLNGAAMHDRTLLGPADVTDEELTRIVGDLLHQAPGSVELLAVRAEHVAYDLPAITTAGRYWVTGAARTAAGERRFRIFVKHVQSWSRSPFFAQVPAEYREMAAASVPWRTEALAYASDLGDRLPDGLSMPRALARARPRRAVRRGLARGGRPATCAVGPRPLPTSGVPPRPDGGEPDSGAPGQRGRLRVVGAHVRHRTAGVAGACRSCAATTSGSTPPSRRRSTRTFATGCVRPQIGSRSGWTSSTASR